MSDESFFDVIIVGTGLVESIAAAALSKAGVRVAHLDDNPYYGNNEASLSLDEFITWCKKQPGSSMSAETLSQARSYTITLSPSVIPSVGPLISSLVSSGVSRYGGFRLVENVSIYDKIQGIVSVPGSKEDVFKNKSIKLVDKRRLMRFLLFAAGSHEDQPEMQGMHDAPFGDFLREKFSLDEDIIKAIVYALAFCSTPSEPTLPTLQRLKRYLVSAGRYGASPFLVGHYGSSGEIAQGFCRAAAVSGGVYILGRKILSDTQLAGRHTITLDDFPEPISCDVLVTAAPSHNALARCVAIVDQPLNTSDTSILVFPPGTVKGGMSEDAVTVLVVGEGTMSTPQGKWIVYISAQQTDASPEELLRPYLACTVQDVVPLFTAFYGSGNGASQHSGDVISPSIPSLPLPESPDMAVRYAEQVFWEVVGKLNKEVDSFWAPREDEDDDESEAF